MGCPHENEKEICNDPGTNNQQNFKHNRIKQQLTMFA